MQKIVTVHISKYTVTDAFIYIHTSTDISFWHLVH